MQPATVIFDTHASIRRLIEKGIEPNHAEAFVAEHVLLHQYQFDQVATKEDIRLLRADICRLEDKVDSKIQSLEDRVNARFQSLEDKVDSKIQSLEDKVDTKIQSLEDKVDAKIQSLEDRIDAKLDHLMLRMTITLGGISVAVGGIVLSAVRLFIK